MRQFDLRLFTIVLCHYDGHVNEWADLQWADSAIHVRTQTCLCQQQAFLLHNAPEAADGLHTDIRQVANEVVVRCMR